MARKVERQPAVTLRPADRLRLKALLDAIPEDADESGPEFQRLLDCWESLGLPSSAYPAVPTYRSKGGEWTTGGVQAVMGTIRQHVSG